MKSPRSRRVYPLSTAIGISLAHRSPSIGGAKGLGVRTHFMERTTMKRLQQGFTLIELMIVVAIVGILAAIALPAYQDYVVRSKMSECVAALAACKTSVQQYASTKNGWPTDTATSGCSTTATQYLASLGVADNGVSTGTSAKP